MLVLSGLTTRATAQAVPHMPDLGRATIEDLLKIEITSASRKEQRADEVPAAVFVITRDDTRRSGKTTIPDLLRLVPGVERSDAPPHTPRATVCGSDGRLCDRTAYALKP
jgi:iron complex outermembrane recepter protein